MSTSDPLPVIAQPVPPSRTGWRGPFDRRGESGWGGVTGWTGEDWNFDLGQAVDGYLYGYGQGRPAAERCRIADSHFDVLFYVRDRDHSFRAVGMYRDAEFLDERDDAKRGPFRSAVRALKHAGVWKSRRSAIRKVRGDKEARRFDIDAPVRWKVLAENVTVFEPAVPIAHAAGGGPKNHRFGTAYHKGVDLSVVGEAVGSELAADPLLEMLLGATFEGRRYAAVHFRRERDTAFIRSIKKARAVQGRLPCEKCGFDFVAEYGEVGLGYIEAHHRQPLAAGADDGQPTQAEDIALLCANCHAIAHRRLALEAKNSDGA